jgi:hypothetical protein
MLINVKAGGRAKQIPARISKASNPDRHGFTIQPRDIASSKENVNDLALASLKIAT